jgi:hypothetical protein
MALIKCPECSKEVSDKAEACPSCAYPVHIMVTESLHEQDEISEISCPICKSHNIQVMIEQTSGKTITRGKTGTKHPGALWNPGRKAMMVGTFGLWGIVGKRKETSKTKQTAITSFKSTTIGLCQKCGYKWNNPKPDSYYKSVNNSNASNDLKRSIIIFWIITGSILFLIALMMIIGVMLI